MRIDEHFPGFIWGHLFGKWRFNAEAVEFDDGINIRENEMVRCMSREIRDEQHVCGDVDDLSHTCEILNVVIRLR